MNYTCNHWVEKLTNETKQEKRKRKVKDILDAPKILGLGNIFKIFFMRKEKKVTNNFDSFVYF